MKKKVIYRLLIVCVVSGWSLTISAQQQHPLSDAKATKEARALYAYINDMFGKKTLSGQMFSGWGFDEINYIHKITGKYPAIKGFDFIQASLNDSVVKGAIQWWRDGGIPTIMWHWGAPGIGEGYPNSKKEIDVTKCFQKGTAEYDSFWTELKTKADLLERLQKANVPVVWRPFHELNGNWFWWGKQGPDNFKRLWITMYDYFVKDRKLNNLIWVLCYTGEPDSAWYPGDKYVDIAGADTYDKGDSSMPYMYKAVKDITGTRVPIAYHECGTPPDPDKCLKDGVMWSWWMEWHTQHLRNVDTVYLKKLYDHELIITRDEVPDIMKVYGKRIKK
jgi:Glycosyl hydrolase family 26